MAVVSKFNNCEDKVYSAAINGISRHYGKLSNKIILDVGCGVGQLGAYLNKNSNVSYGITISEAEAKLARKHLRRVDVLDLDKCRELPYKERCFDVVIFSDVLEHLVNPSRILQMVRKYLRDGALVIASIPNVANIKVRFDLLMGRFEYQSAGILDNTHLRFYTKITATDLIRSAGYEIEDVKYTSWNWDFPKWFRIAFAFRLWEIRSRLIRKWPGMFATQFVIYAKYRPLVEKSKKESQSIGNKLRRNEVAVCPK